MTWEDVPDDAGQHPTAAPKPATEHLSLGLDLATIRAKEHRVRRVLAAVWPWFMLIPAIVAMLLLGAAAQLGGR